MPLKSYLTLVVEIPNDLKKTFIEKKEILGISFFEAKYLHSMTNALAKYLNG